MYDDAITFGQRQIKKNYRSITGHFPSIKNNTSLGFESKLEKAHFLSLEFNNEVISYHVLLKYSKWRFIFVDPFSNEVNLNNLIELLQKYAKLQDFMIFINFQSLKRIIGRYPEHENTAIFLGVDKKELKNLITSNDLINECIRTRFSAISKDYVINISIPTTREGKIVEKDNFQLLLGTNSIGVSDTFLNSYFESLEEYKGNFTNSLFDNFLEPFSYSKISF